MDFKLHYVVTDDQGRTNANGSMFKFIVNVTPNQEIFRHIVGIILQHFSAYPRFDYYIEVITEDNEGDVSLEFDISSLSRAANMVLDVQYRMIDHIHEIFK